MVAYYVPFRGLPLALDLRCFITSIEEVTWHPLISGLRMTMLLDNHFQAELTAKFLLHVHLIIPALDGTEWYSDFWDYIFPQALTPHIQPNLVVISMGGVPGGASNYEWLEGEDTSDDSGDLDF